MSNLTEVYREIKREISKEFNVQVSATRGFYEDERMKGDIGLSFKPTIGKITTYNGHRNQFNKVLLTCFITVPRRETSQLERLELASSIFAFFGSRFRYENFLIMETRDFQEDFIFQGKGEIYRFYMEINIDEI